MFLERILLAYLIILFLSFLISLTVFFRKETPTYLKLFPPFLILTLLVEYIGHQLALKNLSNTLLYNAFIAFEFVFYFFVMRRFIKNAKIKKVIFYASCIYPMTALVNILFIQGPRLVNTYTHNFAALLLIGFCAYFFYEFVKRPTLLNPAREPAFWITSGLIFFYSVTLPLMAAINLSFVYRFIDVKYLVFLQIAPNYILYSLFAIAFICHFKYGNSPLKEGKKVFSVF